METTTANAVAADPQPGDDSCMTFKQAAEKWMKDATSRSRRPIRLTSLPTIKSALRLYIYPAIGTLELSKVNNKTCLPVVERMKRAKLSPSSMNSYFNVVKAVVGHEINPDTGEPKHLRKWSAKYLDIPVVEYTRTPMITGEKIEHMLEHAKDEQEYLLWLVLASTGMRISEVLALEWENVINDYRTIRVTQQLNRFNKIVRVLKTKSGMREIDVCKDVAFWLEAHGKGETGLVFKTRNGKPYQVNNLSKRRLHYFVAFGFHAFRRYRNSHLRSVSCQPDLLLHWMGHRPESMTELYSKLSRDLPFRLKESERVGTGFEVKPMLAGKRMLGSRRMRSDAGKKRSPGYRLAIEEMKKRLRAAGKK